MSVYVDGISRRGNVLDLSVYRPPARPVEAMSPAAPQGAMDGVHRKVFQPETATSAAAAVKPPRDWARTAVDVLPLALLAATAAITPLVYPKIILREAPPVLTAQPAPVQPTQHAVAPLTDIQNALNEYSAGSAVPISAMMIDLKTGAQAGTGAEKVFTSASLYKLFVAQAVYKMVDSGSLTLSSAVKGTGLSVEQCLNRMITVSDNPCAMALGSVIGWEKQNTTLAAAGYTGTTLHRTNPLKTTAGDTALLLKRLYDGTLLSPNSTQHFLDLLKAQKINNRLPASLPAGTVVAHKTGDLDGLSHDAGIVYGPKGDYVIAVMSGPWSNMGQAATSIAQLSVTVYGLANR
ncbi:MAG TPA: serine hydrolase [Candidatus Dormibacteraeota bacterium]|nr:serine hydrolase [Candidatus Dormibacteraeota bacterium]